MRRAIIYLLFIFFCANAVPFSARAAGPTYVPLAISEPTTWTKENSPYIIRSKLSVNAKLTIKPGTVVKFSSPGNWIDAQAEVSAVGTEKEKIYFTSIHDDSIGGNSDAGSEKAPQPNDWDRINISPDYPARFDNAVFSYGNTAIKSVSSGLGYRNLEINNSEIKFNNTGIDILNVAPKIENNIISNNLTGISAKLNAAYQSRVAVLRYNLIMDNGVGVFVNNSLALTPPTVDARHNWWGDDSGPYARTKNSGGKGNGVAEYWVSFDPWLKADPALNPDPVIIIPGIMGSWQKDGVWQIDPIFHTYDNLCEEFLANGYENGKNFSVFPYEWRNSNIENAKLLRDRINEIKKQTGWSKVDIVAHSMGGLLAREYIESDYYQNDVDQLITVGTPHLGAPKVYIKWEAGAFFADIFEQAGKYFFKHEAKENGYDSIFHYLRGRPMSSVQELLPVYDYLWDDNGSGYDLRSGYPANYPRNEFLENLNNAEKIKALKSVEFTKIIGKQDKPNTTISGYNVINADMGELWKHGYPHGFEIPKLGDQGVKKDYGDETVPLYSAESPGIPAEKIIYSPSEHNILPTDAQQDILEILTGKRPSEKIDEWQIDDILIGLVFSPVDIQIISPSGKRLGKNFETGGEYNEIEGAYYAGFDTNTEFLTIPNPENGEYRILAQGTGTGDYKIEIVKISENEEKEAEESTATFTGTAEPDKEEELKIEIKNDEVKKVEKLTIPEPVSMEIHTGVSSNVSNSSLENDVYILDDQSKIQKLDSLKNDIRQYFKTGEIKTRKEARSITEKLSHIRVYLKRYATKTSPKELRTAKRKANRDINSLISGINRDFPKKITEEAKNYITGILEELKID